jgi:tripartite-type tricarboxylate transporter receptor subunit TctC
VHYDPVRDFTPIGLIGTASMFFFVNPAVKAETAEDFVALAKADPEKITIASGGIGSATHLTAELFQARTGIKLVHVPFRGADPAMNDLVAGHVQSDFTTLATASSVLDRVRALAIASETRAGDAGEYSDVQGRRHRSCRRALVGRARSGRPTFGDRRTSDGGPQSHPRLA